MTRKSSGCQSVVGDRHGYLVVFGKPFRVADRKYGAVLLCDCGQHSFALIQDLKRGRVKSCGCLKSLRARMLSRRRIKHGGSRICFGGKKTRLYGVWCSMVARCCRPKHSSYAQYGAKGISICEEWRRDFGAFRDWAESSGYQLGLTIDRIDPRSGYSPANCQWITRTANSRKVWTDMRLRESELIGRIAELEEENKMLRGLVDAA